MAAAVTRWQALFALGLGACALLAPPVSVHALAWVAFAPVFVLAVTLAPKAAARLCAAFGAAYIVGQAWPFVSLGWWGWGSASADEAAWFLLRQRVLLGAIVGIMALWSGVLWGLCGWLTARVARRSMAQALVAAPWLWLLVIEWFGHLSVGGLSFGMFGYHLHASALWRQTAAAGGVLGLSALILLANAALAWILVSRGRARWQGAPLVIAAMVLAAAAAYGAARLREPVPDGGMTVAVVQPGAQLLTLAGDRMEPVIAQALDAARQAGASLIVLPETVWYRTWLQDDGHPPSAGGAPIRTGALHAALQPWLIGRTVLVHGIDAVSGGRMRNTMVYWTKDGVAGAYAKRQLVPFAEYRPVGLSWLTPQNQLHGSGFAYAAGAGPQLSHAGGTVFGSLICQELLYPYVARDAVRAGAQVLVTAGNDGVFTSRFVADAFADWAVLRAVELGRPIVRSMKTGTSLIVDGRGMVLAQTRGADAALLTARITPQAKLTPYARWAGWPAGVAAFVLAGLVGLAFLVRPVGSRPRSGSLVSCLRTQRAVGRAGFTLMEVIMASVIASLVAGGTLAAFIAAARMTARQGSPAYAEAGGFAQQTLERIRNAVAADDTWFQTQAAIGTWIADALPGGGGSESIQALPAKRCYLVTPRDCDALPGNDCYSVSVQVCWRDFTGCLCP